jgi:hypothetical protein
MAIEASKWKWFGHAAHLIVGSDCRFHMATLIGKYMISTVGEYWPDRQVREIHAKVHDPEWLSENQHRRGDDFDSAYMQRFGYETIGCDRKYETMVFNVHPGEECKCGCGLPQMDYSEIDASVANEAKAAREGHMKLCAKYARRKS